MSVVTIAVAISAQWIQQAITRYLPGETRADVRARLKQALVLALVLTAIPLLLTGSAGHVLARTSPNWGQFWLPAALLSALLLSYRCLSSVLQAEMRATRYTLYMVIYSVSQLILSVGVVLFIWSEPAGVLWGATLAVALVTPALWRDARVGNAVREIVSENRAVLSVLRRFGTYGMPILGWFVCATLLSVADRFVIQWSRGEREVGIYAASYILGSGMVTVVTAPLLLAAQPILMKRWQMGDQLRAGQLLGRLVEWLIVLGAMMVVGLALFHDVLGRLLLGHEFSEGSWVMAVVGVGVLAWAVAMYAHKPLEFAERTSTMFLWAGVAAVLNLILNATLVPRFGYAAAAYTTSVSYMSYLAVISWLGRKVLPWSLDVPAVARKVGVVLAVCLAALLLREFATAIIGYRTTTVLVGLVVFIPFGLVLRELVEGARRQLDLLSA